MYNYATIYVEGACGDSSLIVRKNILHRPIKLNTHRQAVAISITVHEPGRLQWRPDTKLDTNTQGYRFIEERKKGNSDVNIAGYSYK